MDNTMRTAQCQAWGTHETVGPARNDDRRGHVRHSAALEGAAVQDRERPAQIPTRPFVVW